MSPHISPSILLKISNLFSEKKWSVAAGTEKHPSLFDKYCSRLKLFEAHHQELVIDLTHYFKIIALKDYLESFYESLILLGQIFDEKEKIFVYPLIDPIIRLDEKDIAKKKITKGKTKSASFLHYMIETDDYMWLSNKLIVDTSLERLEKRFDNRDSCLVLIDDYVGSGKTAGDVCKVYLHETKLEETFKPENIKVVSIAAQEGGVKYLKKELDIDVVSNIIMTRGISDFYTGEVLERKKAHMAEIEATLKVSEDYNFGYERTEALISFMNKTPNNTFPVYWHETSKKIAPFPRYKNYRHE